MIELSWDSSVTKNPLTLADAIELTVAFGSEFSNGHFTRADFQNRLDTESLSDDEQKFLDGEAADQRNEQFDQALNLVRNRALWLDQMYPFRAGPNAVHFQPESTLGDYLSYLFLLVCSNASAVPSLKTRLPVQFEELCKEAFRSLFPSWAKVVSFSQHSKERASVFGYSASDAIPKLAKKLNATVVNAHDIPDTQREFGIDLVAICPFGDASAYPVFAFAQCTITEQWWEKRHEAIADTALTGFINLTARHSNFLMIPFFPRYSLSRWSEDPGRTGNCILCDRFRLCQLLKHGRFASDGDIPKSIEDVFETLKENLYVTNSGCNA